MIGIRVEKYKDNVVIKWRLSRVEIPTSEILDVYLDDTYGGEEKKLSESAHHMQPLIEL